MLCKSINYLKNDKKENLKIYFLFSNPLVNVSLFAYQSFASLFNCQLCQIVTKFFATLLSYKEVCFITKMFYHAYACEFNEE
jgi:hypothetical protein